MLQLLLLLQKVKTPTGNQSAMLSHAAQCNAASWFTA
jgi:hypothetical protein